MRNIKKIVQQFREHLLDCEATYYLKKAGNRNKKSIIRIGFIVQMAEIWDKEIGIYDELKSRANVETVLIVVPPYDLKTSENSLSYDNNYFLKRYPDAVKALHRDGSVINIQELHLDYVFFQRPYDTYLPKELRSSEVVKHTQCCYIPYGYAGSDVFNGGNTNLNFFRNMSYVFLESDYMKFVFQKKYAHRMMFKYQHYETLGYSDLENYFEFLESKTIHNILWTPRWSYNPKLGGSHFFEYQELPFQIKEKYPEIEFVFRPHPLMFDEFVKQGLMKLDEADNYKNRIVESSIIYDSGTIISDAIRHSNLLITDYSSIIINYFLTGKPIIYCKADYELNEEYSKIAKCMYIAENEQQIKKYVKMLLNGDDPLAKVRSELIEEYKQQHIGASKRIVDCLLSS